MKMQHSEADIIEEHNFNNRPLEKLGGISKAVAKQLNH